MRARRGGDPGGVLATAGGALLIADNQRIRRIAADGTIATVAGVGLAPGGDLSHAEPIDSDEGKPATQVPLLSVGGLAQLPGGEVLFSAGGLIGRLSADGRFHTFLRFRPNILGRSSGSPMTDFAGRQVLDLPSGLAVTSEGGLLIATGYAAYYLAPRHSRHALVAIRGARVSAGQVTISIDATRAAKATLTVLDGARRLARSTQAVHAGRQHLHLTARFAPRPYQVRVTLHAANAVDARDAVRLYLSRQLRYQDAKALGVRYEDETPLQGCRRLGVRRVDCAYATDETCESVASFTLKRTGVIWMRFYRCARATNPFRRHPVYNTPGYPVSLT